jgi:hypothetical protein
MINSGDGEKVTASIERGSLGVAHQLPRESSVSTEMCFQESSNLRRDEPALSISHQACSGDHR